MCDAMSMPPELENVARTGRVEGLGLLTATHSPRDYHRDLRRLVTEWVCFNMVEPKDLEAVRPYYSGVDKSRSCRMARLSRNNRESGAELAGRVF